MTISLLELWMPIALGIHSLPYCADMSEMNKPEVQGLRIEQAKNE